VASAQDGAEHLAELVSRLALFLLNDIDHEEHEGLPLIDATVTEQARASFSAPRRLTAIGGVGSTGSGP